jgi:hypothetical protein
MRWAARSARPAALAGLTLAALAGSACGSSDARTGQTPSYLIVDRLQFKPSQSETTFNSDVASDNGSIFEDAGAVIFRAGMRDETNANAPSQANAITVTRYRVVFTRSDGRNTPGVDVPYAFDGAMTATVDPGGAVIVPFVMVRVQAKLEAPLAALRGHGGAAAISTIAEVTFYGHDQVGRETQATGLISINFADWAG